MDDLLQFKFGIENCVSRFIESEIAKESLPTASCTYEEVDPPAPRETVDLEASVSSVDENVRESSNNFASLM